MTVEINYKGIILEIKGIYYPEDEDVDYCENFNISSIHIGGSKDIQCEISNDATEDIVELVLEKINE